MYGKKIPKTQQPDKTPFTYHPLHPDRPMPKLNPDTLTVVSIDPATVNLGFRIEVRKSNGIITMKEYSRTNFKNPNEEEGVSEIYSKLNVFLDQYTNYYKNADLIVIERQMPYNYKAVRISQHIISYFISYYRHVITNKNPLIVEIDPQLKSRALQGPKGMNNNDLKKWSVTKATELLEMRNDQPSLTVLKKEKRKADDLADVVCQVEAFCVLQNLPLTRKLETILM